MTFFLPIRVRFATVHRGDNHQACTKSAITSDSDRNQLKLSYIAT